jgi:hypothetical protein
MTITENTSEISTFREMALLALVRDAGTGGGGAGGEAAPFARRGKGGRSAL